MSESSSPSFSRARVDSRIKESKEEVPSYAVMPGTIASSESSSVRQARYSSSSISGSSLQELSFLASSVSSSSSSSSNSEPRRSLGLSSSSSSSVVADIAQPAFPLSLHTPSSIAPRAAHFQPAQPDEKALVLIKNSRDHLLELGNLISEENRGRLLKRLAFYEKLARHAQLIPRDTEKLNETQEEIDVISAKHRSLVSRLVSP